MVRRPQPSPLWLALMAGCFEEEPTVPTSPTDPDTATDTGEEAPLADLVDLLAGLPGDTAWADLPPSTQAALAAHAEATALAFRAEWDDAALRAKEAVILADAGPIAANVDAYTQALGGDAGLVTADLEPALADALARLYLAHLGQARNILLWSGWLVFDWDGVTPLTTSAIPDPVASADLQAYADEVATDLEALLPALPDGQAPLATRAWHRARSLRTGSVDRTGVGGDDLRFAPTMMLSGTGPVFDRAFLGVYPDDEAYLRDQNAFWIDEVVRLDANTQATAAGLTGPLFTLNEAAWTSTLYDQPEIGTMAYLLSKWWFERLEARPEAAIRCRANTPAELDRMADALTGDLEIDPGAAWLDTFDAARAADADALAAAYRAAAHGVVEGLLDPPDAAALAAVDDALVAEARFGTLLDAVRGALDGAGRPDVIAAFDARLASAALGGDPAQVDPAERAAAEQSLRDVRAWLVDAYGGRTVDLDALLPAEAVVSAGGGSGYDESTGTIGVDLGSAWTLPELHLFLLGEALHATYHLAGLPHGFGTGGELLLERGVGRRMLAELAPAGDEALWALLPLAQDAREFGLAAATVAVLREPCTVTTDSAEVARAEAGAWGLDAGTVASAALRAHWGTAELGGLAGQVASAEVLAWFEDRLGEVGLDPFDLASCGISEPLRTDAEVAVLSACLPPR